MIHTLFIVIFLLSGIAVNLYVPIYMTRPWSSTSAGRALMLKAVGNLVVVDMSIAALMFGDYPGREWVRLIGISLFCAGMWYLLIVLIKTPHKKRTR